MIKRETRDAWLQWFVCALHVGCVGSSSKQENFLASQAPVYRYIWAISVLPRVGDLILDS